MKVIFDLDGTLADITHRLHHIRGPGPKDWPAFFKACVYDAPIRPMLRIANYLHAAGALVEVWTARSDEVRSQTEFWLQGHLIPHAGMRMRAVGDHRQDDVLKAEWLAQLPRHQRPDIVFEDRQRVVDMWRANGIMCCQVSAGEF